MTKLKLSIITTSLLSLSLGLLPVIAQDSDVASENDSRIMHVLNRITFGPRPGDFERVKKMGIQKYINQQLDAASIPEAPEVADYISAHPTLSMSTGELFQNYGKPVIKAALEAKAGGDNAANKKEIGQIVRDNYKKVIGDVSGEHIARALFTPKQLEEVMTDFWFNHFNVSKDKGFDHIWIGNFEDQAIRPYALSNFRALLGATSHHPAMLFYLDNWQNSMPGADPNFRPMARFLGAAKKKQKQGINENFARELMELHTLGVDGGYTQDDVISLAHVLTGLSLPPLRPAIGVNDVGSSGYRFYPQRHDFGAKVLLGQHFSGGGNGEEEIEHALDLLASEPATAHHISYQLAQYFIADDPPKAAVDACAATFTKTRGDIKSVLKTLFARPEFWDEKYSQTKFKSPQRYVISSLRASDIIPTNFYPFLGYLNQAGQPLYGCLTPDGYKTTRDAWLNPDGLIKRINIATALGVGKMPGATGLKADPAVVMSSIGKELNSNTLDVVTKTPPGMKAALLLGSPEFMKY